MMAMRVTTAASAFLFLFSICSAKPFDVPFSRVVKEGEKIEKNSPYFRYVKEGDWIPDIDFYQPAASVGNPVRYAQNGQYVPTDEGKYRPTAKVNAVLNNQNGKYVPTNEGKYKPTAAPLVSNRPSVTTFASSRPIVSSQPTVSPVANGQSTVTPVISSRPAVTSVVNNRPTVTPTVSTRPTTAAPSKPVIITPVGSGPLTNDEGKYRPTPITSQARTFNQVGDGNGRYRPFATTLGNDVKYLHEGQYIHDDSGRYIHDDSGRYIHDNSGVYIDDGTGRYTHVDVPYKPEATVIRKQYLIPYGLFPGAKFGNFDDNRWRIIRLYNDQNKDGYHYDYETENEIFGAQDAVIQNKGTDNEIINAQGYYRYTAPNNVIYEVEYTADENGFIPMAAHLHPALKRALEYQLSSKDKSKH